jgi:lipopolysaccharide transport system ATP-binding protein
MSDTVIKVENLSKLYRLGEISTGTLRSDFQRWWAQMRGKEDPLAKVGHENDRSQKAEKGESIWALKDINFEVRQGEVLGIIGKNGAGKSTLLKILSQVTTPTTGEVKVKGRIASLLEVGTGFHPELTGRENIFLNGAILGMTKSEIRSKFDEIVEFSGVAKYIDTPVKRYSSGMYVRLAFAVAAHLEPEILIVDEVLAVGDVEFQEKCLGKMKDVSSNHGRTVLFVSHNMGAISEICNKALSLKKGMIQESGDVMEVVRNYLFENHKIDSGLYNSASSKEIFIKNARIIGANNENIFKFSEPITLSFTITDTLKTKFFKIGMAILDGNGSKVFTTISNSYFNGKDEYKIKIIIPSRTLLSGYYSIDISTFIPGSEIFDYVSNQCSFKVIDFESEFAIFSGSDIGKVNINCQWVLD